MKLAAHVECNWETKTENNILIVKFQGNIPLWKPYA